MQRHVWLTPGLVVCLLLFTTFHAFADTAVVYPDCKSASYDAGQLYTPQPQTQNQLGQHCPGPIPMANTPPTVLGTQFVSTASLAVVFALTIPTGTTAMDVSVDGINGTDPTTAGPNGCIRWKDDGANPTADIGFTWPANTIVMGWQGNLTALRLIRATGATCNLNVRYWK